MGDKAIGNLIFTHIEEDDAESFKFKWRINLPVIVQHYKHLQSYVVEKGNWQGSVFSINGEKSNFVNKEKLESLKIVFPNINLEKDSIFIKDAGHWVHSERP